jgi:hypothetical protein
VRLRISSSKTNLSKTKEHEFTANCSKEFGREVELLGGGDNAELRLESTYTRSTVTTGKPLTDGYHFGETITNDFGRPEEQGFNNVSGLSGWAADGPFAVYVRSEYQHSPSAPALPVGRSRGDLAVRYWHPTVPPPYPVPPDTPTASVDRGRLLDTYVAMNISDWQLSYGKQSLWWGPSEGGGMMLSDNCRSADDVSRQSGHASLARIPGRNSRGVFHRTVFRIRVHVHPCRGWLVSMAKPCTRSLSSTGKDSAGSRRETSNLACRGRPTTVDLATR